jgi:hypothetical protein
MFIPSGSLPSLRAKKLLTTVKLEYAAKAGLFRMGDDIL